MIAAETVLAIVGGLIAAAVGISVVCVAIYWSALAYFDMRREIVRIKILAIMGMDRVVGHHSLESAIHEWVETDIICNEEKDWSSQCYDGSDVERLTRRIVERILKQMIRNEFPHMKNKAKP